eukprot:scaffold1727_cov133-Cylindrotheca_fusiformis.AAC.53
MEDSRNYDPSIIIKAADDKLAANDVSGGQTMFQTALLNWVDDARFNASSLDPEQMREAIATLWTAYAHFLRKAKQFKSATEAYEQAVDCPVSGGVGRIWVDYARFLDERDKLRTAQQVYIRALHENGGGKVKDEQDRALLWNEFLEMMRKRSPTLTLPELKEAIEKQNQSGPTPDDVSSTKRQREDDYNDDDDDILMKQEMSAAEQQQQQVLPESRTHVVTPADIDLQKQVLQELAENAQHDPSFMAAWLVRDGTAAPQPPPPLFACSPPKLSDPTGKDLLGVELALELIQTLLKPKGSAILQVCRGLWMLHGLKVHQSQKALSRLDETILTESRTLKQRLDERLSVSGAAEAAVRQMNESERQSFEDNCNQQRQALLSSIAWEQRHILWCQQQLLTKLQIPGFEGTTVDSSELKFQTRICSYLHSAFFLQQRIGEKAYQTMLKSQKERLDKHLKQHGTATSSSSSSKRKKSRFSPPLANTTTNAAATTTTSSSARLTPPPPPNMSYGVPPPPPPPPAMGGYGMTTATMNNSSGMMQQQQVTPGYPPNSGNGYYPH